MSNPISTLPGVNVPNDEPKLEVDGPFDTAESPPLEVDEIEEASEPSVEDSEPVPGEADTGQSKSRMGLIALVLAVLLVGSIAINLKQSRDVATLETQSAEIEQALDAAVERIDVETARANSAESALDRVDGAVDIVNEQVLGLQEALNGLREATAR